MMFPVVAYLINRYPRVSCNFTRREELDRPLISTDVPGIPELIRGGQSGCLAAADDVEALSDVLRECLAASTAALDRLGLAGRQQVQCRHDADAEARKLGELPCRSPSGIPRVARESEVRSA